MTADFTSRGNGTWGWRPRRGEGIWKYGPGWAKPLAAAAPWITVGLLVLMFRMVSDRFVSRPGTVFDLPCGEASADIRPEHVALMLSVPRETAGGAETLVYFDDARYILSDDSSVQLLSGRLSELVGPSGRKSLLLMCDRRVSHGDVMKFTDIARSAGIGMVQVAERSE